jgi:large subunit ribosomal protein L14e
MYEIGRLAIKIAGRDSGKKCVVVDIVDDHFVLIDGQTRRRKCNIIHLEPLDKVLKIKKGASHAEIVDMFKKEGMEVSDTKPKEKATKPVRSKTEKQETDETKKQTKSAKKEKK